MRIGELAKLSGVGLQTLRYYERRGLITKPARQPSGYRDYSPDMVRLIRLIKWAQRIGFTLDEIKELIALVETHAPNGAVRARAAAKVRDVDEKIRNLQTIREALQALADCSCKDKCPIINAALDGHTSIAHSRSVS